MSKMTSVKRKEITDLIIGTMSRLDPTGMNVEYYNNIFKKLSLEEFDKYIKKVLDNENDYFTLNIVDYEAPLTMENIQKTSEFLDIPLFEHIALPFINMDLDTPVVSKFPIFVGYAHIKRTQQTVMNKNSTSVDIAERSALTGQVTGNDKNGRESDSENFAMVTLGAEYTLQELMGPRADDMVMKREMHNDIRSKGYTNLEGMTNDVDNKTTLNTVDVSFTSMGFKTDLVSDSLIRRKTLDEN